MAPTDLSSLSAFLGFASQHLFYLVQLADKMYFEFEIEKANGGRRKISAPRTELKGVQRAILEKILEPTPVDESCYAYVRGRSVVQAAQRLSGHKAVLHLDIEDFFPTITRKRVLGLFKSIGFNSKVSYLLSKLCTLDSKLCQGAPTSPYLSNLIFRNADRQFSSLATTFNLQYIRYSDVIFFFADRNFNYSRVAEIADKILTENGFVVHKAKTRYHRRNTPRFTLGLQTSGKQPQLGRSTKRIYRAAFFKASHNLKWGEQNVEYLSGIAEWYKSVYGANSQYRDYSRIIRNVQSIKFHDVYVQS